MTHKVRMSAFFMSGRHVRVVFLHEEFIMTSQESYRHRP